MRKISFKISREIVQALVHLCAQSLQHKSGDSLFDLWLRDNVEALLLKLAKFRNKSAKNFSLSLNFTEIILVREITDIRILSAPNAPEVLLSTEYILTPALSITL
jgi:hypothetical protein